MTILKKMTAFPNNRCNQLINSYEYPKVVIMIKHEQNIIKGNKMAEWKFSGQKLVKSTIKNISSSNIKLTYGAMDSEALSEIYSGL